MDFVHHNFECSLTQSVVQGIVWEGQWPIWQLCKVGLYIVMRFSVAQAMLWCGVQFGRGNGKSGTSGLNGLCTTTKLNVAQPTLWCRAQFGRGNGQFGSSGPGKPFPLGIPQSLHCWCASGWQPCFCPKLQQACARLLGHHQLQSRHQSMQCRTATKLPLISHNGGSYMIPVLAFGIRGGGKPLTSVDSKRITCTRSCTAMQCLTPEAAKLWTTYTFVNNLHPFEPPLVIQEQLC